MDIKDFVAKYTNYPVLFVGTGLSLRYLKNLYSCDPIYVLLAMGIPVEKIESSVRVSWGAGVDSEEVVDGFGKMLEMAKSLAL